MFVDIERINYFILLFILLEFNLQIKKKLIISDLSYGDWIGVWV